MLLVDGDDRAAILIFGANTSADEYSMKSCRSEESVCGKEVID